MICVFIMTILLFIAITRVATGPAKVSSSTPFLSNSVFTVLNERITCAYASFALKVQTATGNPYWFR